MDSVVQAVSFLEELGRITREGDFTPCKAQQSLPSRPVGMVARLQSLLRPASDEAGGK